MYWIAFTLGFLGSLHCIGMCGPLALAVCGNVTGNFRWQGLIPSVLYNSGRTVSYMALGVFFGFFGSLVAMAGFQKFISIGAGFILVCVFLFSVNIDHFIGKFEFFKYFYKKISNLMSTRIRSAGAFSYLIFGLLNGLLPCGLVYLAIAGAISLSDIWGSMGFMLFFGLGTFPAMVTLILFHGAVSHHRILSFQKLYPFISLILGVYLMYRGVFSQTPLQLDFYDALKNPVLCH